MSLLGQLATKPEFTVLANAWCRTVELGQKLAIKGGAQLDAVTAASTATGEARRIVGRYLTPGNMAAFDAARAGITSSNPAVRQNAVATLHQGIGQSATMMAEHGGYGAFMIASPDKAELVNWLRMIGGYAGAAA